MDGAEQAAAQPLTRREADDAYRRIRMALLFSVALMLAIALVLALLDVEAWPIYVGAIVIFEGIGLPLALRYIRRNLDRRVRASEGALGKE